MNYNIIDNRYKSTKCITEKLDQERNKIVFLKIV